MLIPFPFMSTCRDRIEDGCAINDEDETEKNGKGSASEEEMPQKKMK